MTIQNPSTNAPVKGPVAPRLVYLLILAVSLGSATFYGCGANNDATDKQPVEAAPTGAPADEHREGETEEVRLTADQIRQAGVAVAEVRRATLQGRFTAPGRVVPGLTGASRVGTLVSGRIARLYTNEGAAVRQGTPLAEVESFEVAELKADYLQALAAAEQAGASFRRHEQLAREDLVPEEKLEQARADYQTAQAGVSAAATKLTALGISPSSIRAAGRTESARFVVRAPIGGTVTKRSVQLGEYVDPGRDLFEVAAQGSEMVEAQVPQDQATRLAPGQSAIAVLPDSTRIIGRVVSVAPVVAAESRTVPVRVELIRGGLRPETFVTVYFESGMAGEALVVPAAAIERSGQEAFVYVSDSRGAGTFRRVPVEVGRETAEGIEVLAGLAPGSRVVVQGVFYLKSARQKGELTEHEH